MTDAHHRSSNLEEVSEVHKLLLTVRETADMLGVGRSKTYELIGRGELHSVLIDGCRRVPTSAVEDYVNNLLAGVA